MIVTRQPRRDQQNLTILQVLENGSQASRARGRTGSHQNAQCVMLNVQLNVKHCVLNIPGNVR